MYGCINEYMINNVFSLCQRVCTKNLFMLANKEQRAQDFKYAKRNHQKHQSINSSRFAGYNRQSGSKHRNQVRGNSHKGIINPRIPSLRPWVKELHNAQARLQRTARRAKSYQNDSDINNGNLMDKKHHQQGNDRHDAFSATVPAV